MGLDLKRVLAICVKEIRQLRRDRLTFGMIVGVPLMQILLFGYAIDLDVREIRTGVVDQARSSLSRQLVQDAEATQIPRVVARMNSEAELESALRSGRVELGIIIPHDLERRLADRDRPAAQLLINGSDPTIGNIAAELTRMPAPNAAAEPSSPVFMARAFYNPEGRSPVHIVPGLIGVILHLTMVLFTAVAIVRERERGNLEMLITTPIKTPELMLGKILPYVAIGLIQVTIILAASSWLFAVPVRGGLLSLYLAAGLFILAALALGLTVSTLARTQFQAMQLTVFTFLPSILLSGFMFPFDGMPRIMQWLGELIPLTHFVRLARGIMVRGASLPELYPEILALLAFFVVFMAIAIVRFQKRLD